MRKLFNYLNFSNNFTGGLFYRKGWGINPTRCYCHKLLIKVNSNEVKYHHKILLVLFITTDFSFRRNCRKYPTLITATTTLIHTPVHPLGPYLYAKTILYTTTYKNICYTKIIHLYK